MRKLLSLGSLIAVVLLVALAASPIYGQTGRGGQGLETAIAAQERHTDALLAKSGVVGTAVGYNAGGVPVVKIFIETAGVVGLPKRLDGVPVVVQVTGRIYALHHRLGHSGGPGGGGEDPPDPALTPTDRWDRPVPIGVSSGSERFITINGDIFCTTGTLGARVVDATDIYALSNAHIYALEGSTPEGVVVAGVNGDRILQPGPADTGCVLDLENDVIGTLADFEPLVFAASDCTGGAADPDCNTIDAAIAISSTDDLDNATPSDGYGTPKTATVAASLNQKVQKYGRTTSLTKGQVFGINATVDVSYDTGVARFVEQIVVFSGEEGFILPGDSGSLLVTQGKGKKKPGGNPVGLLFAGNAIGTFGFANPIDLVLDAFGVTIDGE